jgi:uncharacterized Tic20 family protein
MSELEGGHTGGVIHERRLAMLCHFLLLITSLIGPLVIWARHRKQSQLVEANGRAALNLFFTVALVLPILALIFSFFDDQYPGIVSFFLLFIGLGLTFFVIIAARAAARGEQYRYRFSLQWIRPPP